MRGKSKDERSYEVEKSVTIIYTWKGIRATSAQEAVRYAEDIGEVNATEQSTRESNYRVKWRR